MVLSVSTPSGRSLTDLQRFRGVHRAIIETRAVRPRLPVNSATPRANTRRSSVPNLVRRSQCSDWYSVSDGAQTALALLPLAFCAPIIKSRRNLCAYMGGSANPTRVKIGCTGSSRFPCSHCTKRPRHWALSAEQRPASRPALTSGALENPLEPAGGSFARHGRELIYLRCAMRP